MNVKIMILFLLVSINLRAQELQTFTFQSQINPLINTDVLRAKVSKTNYLKVSNGTVLSEIYFNNGDRVILDVENSGERLININGIDGAILNNGRYIHRDDLGEVIKYEGSINIGGISGIDLGSIYAASGGSESGGG